MSAYMKWTDEEIEPYAAEAAAKLRADIKLRLERQKQWPEIEERRRQKLAQIYPSHTDGEHTGYIRCHWILKLSARSAALTV